MFAGTTCHICWWTRNSSVKNPWASPLLQTSWHESNSVSKTETSFFKVSTDLGTVAIPCHWGYVLLLFQVAPTDSCHLAAQENLGDMLLCTIVIRIVFLQVFDRRTQLSNFLHDTVHKLLEAIFGLSGSIFFGCDITQKCWQIDQFQFTY